MSAWTHRGHDLSSECLDIGPPHGGSCAQKDIALLAGVIDTGHDALDFLYNSSCR
jgi:hypothetical protein